MRIVVHGQQAFGKAVLEALLKRGENVVAAYVAPEKPGQKADPLKEAALAAKLPVYQPASYRKPEVWEEFRALKPDLQVMAFVTLVRAGGFPQHPDQGLDPVPPLAAAEISAARARSTGRSSRAKRETGLSIFWPDNGLDTGDVLLQKKTPISDTDSLGSVYFDRLFPMGVEAMLEAVDLVKAGKAPRIKQDHSVGDLRGPLRRRQCPHRLGQAVAADPQPHPRLQSGAGRLDDARWQDAADLRGEAAAGARSQRASAARWARSSRSTARASRSSAPTAASRSCA